MKIEKRDFRLVLSAVLLALSGCTAPAETSGDATLAEDGEAAPSPASHAFGPSMDACVSGPCDCNDWTPWDSLRLNVYDVPATAFDDDHPSIYYRGPEDHIYSARYFNGAWEAGVRLGDIRSPVSPAVTIHDGVLNLFFKDMDGQFFRMTRLREEWGAPELLPFTFTGAIAPAVVSFQGKLQVFFGDRYRRLFSAIHDGTGWGQAFPIRGAYADTTPAVAWFDNRLFVGHRGLGNRFFISELQQQRLVPKVVLRDVHMGLRTAFGVHDGLLHFAYSTYGNEIAWRAFDGNEWFGSVYLPGTCDTLGLGFGPFGDRASLFCPDGRDGILKWTRYNHPSVW